MPISNSKPGERTGTLYEHGHQVMVYAFESKICVDFVELVYGELEDTFEGPHYRLTLGAVLHESEFDPFWPQDLATAKQADRSLQSGEVQLFPSDLRGYVQLARENWLSQ